MASAVPKVEGGEHVSDDGKDRYRQVDTETREGDQRERQRRAELQDAELVWAQRQVSAREVRGQRIGSLLGRDPDRCSGGLEPAPQLLPDVSESAIRDASARASLRLYVGAVAGDDAVHHEDDPERGCDRHDHDRQRHC